jgi:uroporphyrinogen decarboxylase
VSREDRFLKACRGEPHDRVPIWLMRQAGRYQPEYRALRERHGMLEIAGTPKLATEVTCLPVERYGLDAAILFSDIMVPLAPAGVAFEIREGVGPVVEHPVRRGADVARLQPIEPARDLPAVGEAVERIVERLHGIPLIGFAGAPFTLASYLIEGRPSRQYIETKRLMWEDPAAWTALMTVLADIVVAHLRGQARAGARALMLFDSWVGALAPEGYRRAVMPVMTSIFRALKDLALPLIYFGVGTGSLLVPMADTGPTVLGIDWRTPLVEARRVLGARVALQGNLDPVTLLCDWPVVERDAIAILEAMRDDPGFVFNLGHGVLPATNPETVTRLAALVHGEGV